ncbi:unnamed protein product [Prunus armeniaca]
MPPKCPLASAWRAVACRRCELSVGLSSCNWASFVDLGSRVEEVVVCPLLRMLRDEQNGPNSDDLPVGQEECSAESPLKRKVAAKSSRDEATPSQVENVSLLRKKPRFPSAKKTQVGSALPSSVRAKHLVGVDSTKVGGMNYVRGILPEPPADKLENHDLLREATCARSSSAKRQRDADIPPRSSSRLHGQKMEIEAGVRLAEAKKMRESSAWAKSSFLASAVDPKANKSSPVGDAPTILAHSQAFPWKNKGKPHFICLKKKWFLLLKLSETRLLLPPLLPLAWFNKKMHTSVLSTRVDAVDEMMADAMEQAD